MEENDYVEFFTDANGETRWHYRSGNNENMATSGEGYKEPSDAIAAATRVVGRTLVFTQIQAGLDSASYVRAQWGKT